MAELADALDSGSSEVTLIQVQVLLPAPLRKGVHLRTPFFNLTEIMDLNLASYACLKLRFHPALLRSKPCATVGS